MLSIWSIVSTILISSFLIEFLLIVTKKSSHIKVLGLPIILISLLFIIVRMLIPLEFPFTRVLISTNTLPIIDTFFRTPIFAYANKYSINLYILIGILWICGALIKIFKLFKDYYHINKSLKLLTVKKGIEQDAMDKIAIENKIPKYLKIIETSAVSTPFICGFIFPTIVFPLYNFTSQEQYFIIKHELEHFTKRDLWIKGLIELICAI